MVINMYGEPIFNYKTKIYIAKKLPSTQDEDMNEVENYAEPQKYMFNIQPVKAESDRREFGEVVTRLKVAVIPKRIYKGKFNEYDKVYIDNTPDAETELDYGDNADYRIYAIKEQNVCIKLYFLKLVNNSMIGDE